MKTRTGLLVLSGLMIVTLAPGVAAAQTIGVFRWQFKPYCNIVTIVVTNLSGVFSLQGADDNCGGLRKSALQGTAFQNPDGTIGLGFSIIGPAGFRCRSMRRSRSRQPLGPGATTRRFRRLHVHARRRHRRQPSTGPVIGDRVPYVHSEPIVWYTHEPAENTVRRGTEISFNPTANQNKLLTFSAECGLGAPAGNFGAWVDLEVIHNGVPLPPIVGTEDAFCGANGTQTAIDGLLRPSITLVVPGVAGVNTISIQGR